MANPENDIPRKTLFPVVCVLLRHVITPSQGIWFSSFVDERVFTLEREVLKARGYSSLALIRHEIPFNQSETPSPFFYEKKGMKRTITVNSFSSLLESRHSLLLRVLSLHIEH